MLAKRNSYVGVLPGDLENQSEPVEMLEQL